MAALQANGSPAERRRLRANLRDEIDGAAVYMALAAAQEDPNLAGVFRQLAAVEQQHAQMWREQLRGHGETAVHPPSWKARMTIWLIRRFGDWVVLPSLVRQETAGAADYRTQSDAAGAGLAADEAGHARVLQAALGAGRGLAGPALAKLEGRHRGGNGNALRAAVLGANDGLVSNLCLVMGFAGAAQDQRTLVLAGIAGLAAGAGSMAMGEWLSVASSRELNRRQIDAEAEELARSPAAERAELALIYRAKGLAQGEAEALAGQLISGDRALETLAREELGLDPRELGGSPWTAAGASFVLFALGAMVPLLPVMVLAPRWGLTGALAASGLALLAFGALTSIFTGRGLVFSAARQLAFGAAAAALTYGLGALAGAALG